MTASDDRAAKALTAPGPGTPVLRRAAVFTAVAALAVVLLAALWYGREIFLLAFAGVLLAVFLRGLADLLTRYTGLPPGWSLAAVVLALAALLGGGGSLLAPAVAAQTDELLQQLPQSVNGVEQTVRRYEWGRRLLAHAPSADAWLAPGGGLVGKITGVFSATLDALGGLVVFLIVGFFLALEPGTYTEGVVRLVPPAGRGRAREVLREMGHTLRWWLLGRGVAMAIVGTATALGLWLLGVPFALPLALLATLLGFIPYFGPLLAGVPAVLLGLTQGPWTAAGVAALYVAVQFLEGNVVTPLVQRRAVEVPPALTVVALLLLGILLGPLGMVVGMPLTAVAFVLVKRLYVEGLLGDRAAGGAPAKPA